MDSEAVLQIVEEKSSIITRRVPCKFDTSQASQKAFKAAGLGFKLPRYCKTFDSPLYFDKRKNTSTFSFLLIDTLYCEKYRTEIIPSKYKNHCQKPINSLSTDAANQISKPNMTDVFAKKVLALDIGTNRLKSKIRKRQAAWKNGGE